MYFLPLSCHRSLLPFTQPTVLVRHPPSLSTWLSSYFPMSMSVRFSTTCPFFFKTLHPTLPHLSHRSAVIWTDVSAKLILPSSCCLPTTTHLPSCVTVTLSPFPYMPLLFTLTASPLSAIFISMVSSPLFFSLNSPSLLPPSLLFPSPRQSCQEDSDACLQAVWRRSVCMHLCACAARYVESTFVFVSASDKERVRRGVCVP